jgi:hypothetical protein
MYAPQHLDKKERLQWLKTIQRNLSVLLKNGFDPYKPDSADLQSVPTPIGN